MDNEQVYNDLEEARRLLDNIKHNMLYRGSMKEYIKTDISFVKALVNKVDLLYNPQPNSDTPQLNKPEVPGLLPSIEIDLFENVECNIEGELKTMHEYRILVEPNSPEHKYMEELTAERQ